MRRGKLGTCDYLETLHTENWKCVGTWQPVTAPAEPAEYTCPRCGSNVSTHICMGEPATENAGKVQATGTHWCLTCGITALGCGHELANRQDDSASAEPVAGETKPWHDGHEWVGVNAAPSVAVPKGEATNVKGESIDLWTNEYLVQRMLENYARSLTTGSESQHNEAFRCRAEVIRRMTSTKLG